MKKDKTIYWIIGISLVGILFLLPQFGLFTTVLPEGQYNEYGDCEFITNVDPINSRYIDYYSGKSWISIDYDGDGIKEAFGCAARIKSSTGRIDRCDSVLLVENYNQEGDDIYGNVDYQGVEQSVFICSPDGMDSTYCQLETGASYKSVNECDAPIGCIIGDERCSRDNYILCVDNKWVNQGETVGKCGYTLNGDDTDDGNGNGEEPTNGDNGDVEEPQVDDLIEGGEFDLEIIWEENKILIIIIGGVFLLILLFSGGKKK